MEEILSQLLLANLQSLGLLEGAKQPEKSVLFNANRYGRWLEESLRVLENQGYLEYNGRAYTNKLLSVELDSLWQKWEREKLIWLQDKNQKALVNLVEPCLRALPDILTGKQKATDVIFPDASLALVENIYQGNAAADFYNQILHNSVIAYIKARLARDSMAQIRILEIGAGTGGTTAGLLEQMQPFQPNIAEYCYTDLSQTFLHHATRKYGEQYPYLVTKIFDVEKPIQQQGISANYYDLVIAANVLHATKNIRHTLRNAKATLRKHGLLVLNEMSTKNLFCHLTFGLLEGWWLYEDEALRISGSPVLSSASWTDVLTEEGFSSITFPALLVAKSAHDFGQQIIIAESNGIVRQKVTATSQVKSNTGRISLTQQDALPEQQLITERGSKERRDFLTSSVRDREMSSNQGGEAIAFNNLREKAIIYIKKLVGATLQISTNQIDSSQSLEAYGLDSIIVIQLTNELRKTFKNISNTLFFEVQNIDGVVDYLLANQSEVFVNLLGLSNEPYQAQTWERRGSKEKQDFLTIPVRDREMSGKQGGEAIAFNNLREKAIIYIKKLVGATLQISTNQIDSSQPLEAYGLDSIIVIQLTNELRKTFKNISNTLFFEVQNINGVVDYLLANQSEVFVDLLGLSKEPYQPQTWERGEKEIDFAKITEEKKSPLLKIESKSARRIKILNESPAIQSPPDLLQKSRNQDIAIIGLSGRYPEAENINDFWQNLKDGKNCITEIPPERWDWKRYFDAQKGKEGTLYTKWGGFIRDVDKFDPLFFQLSAREAERMDPQERLFLQCAYNCIEDAGYTPATLCDSRKVGVFVGVMNSTYPLQPSYWSIANRVSYLFNFQGPSLSVDSACSSSLTALHLAVESLHSGTSDCAIAGGVNLILDPIQYLSLSAMTMLSATNECKSFGDQADGFVDGEGVGAVILKLLDRAEQDGDSIYGVIKGSMINAGGKTNGYTVPNPIAQSQLIREALARAEVNPRTVSYLEAHGTGTPLGDPIEVTGLTKGFATTKDKQFCAIGSVKSNIGHTESAAGIAGLTKILLQLKHRQLVPSLHSQQLNPHIDFGETPFVVQRKLAPWLRPVVTLNGETKEYPRIAGISSFGAGGANAHLVIQEYLNQEVAHTNYLDTGELKEPSLIVLSAKDEARLREIAENLCHYARDGRSADGNLTSKAQFQSMAYTLQVGREAMEERLGLVAASWDELTEILQEFLAGKSDGENWYRGQVKPNKAAMSVLIGDEEFAQTFQNWVNQGKYHKILNFWVKGFVFDWNKLYGENRPRRIHLPTYPFARERYWAKPSNLSLISPGSLAHPSSEFLHPLVHKNTSDLAQQCFSSTFNGQEFFLADHRINGEKVLPGVAYLEMARAAIKQALPSSLVSLDKTQIQLKNIIWSKPFIVNGEAKTLHIKIFPLPSADGQSEYTKNNNNGEASLAEIGYEIYSNAANEVIVHSQGVASFSPIKEVPALDLSALQEKINHKCFSQEQCYATFKAMGIEYGQGQQGIEEIYVSQSQDSPYQVLAKLKLPTIVAGTAGQFVLHPSLIDSALQACIGLTGGQSRSEVGPVSVPFGLERLEILQKPTDTIWTWIRYSHLKATDQQTLERRLTKLDLDLCDEQGNICVQLQGFSSLDLVKRESSSVSTWMSSPAWQEKAIPENEPSQSVISEPDQRLVMLYGLEGFSTTLLESQIQGTTCIHLKTQATTLDKQFLEISVQVFEKIKESLKEKRRGTTLIQIVLSASAENQLFISLIGVLKTAHLENPAIRGQLIALDCHQTQASLTAKIQQNGYHLEDTLIRYQEEIRQTISWQEVSVSESAQQIPWQEGGVYLITGGLGGLGFILAQHIAQQTQKVTLILTGRSALDEGRRKQIKQLEALGASVDYRQIDISHQQETEGLIEAIENEIGTMKGIFHCAGIVRDNFMLKKTASEFEAVLAPKVAGLINLDRATKNLNLDFFVLFSSLAGVNGNLGQADYACANAFMDAYAHYRNQLVANQERSGQTISFNWPLWQEGGMQIGSSSGQAILKNSGLVAMETKRGIESLVQGLASGQSQLMVLTGDWERLQVSQQEDLSSLPSQDEFEPEVIQEKELEKRSLHYFKNLVSSALKIPPHRLQHDELLEIYGIDSVVMLQLTNQLEQVFGSLAKTLFFEYPTIEEISDYFIKNYREKLKAVLSLKTDKKPKNQPVAVVNQGNAKRENKARFLAHDFDSSPLVIGKKQDIQQTQDIAIIGVAGRYPLSPNLEIFWENLTQGKNCITEIPVSRWDHNLYFAPEPANEPKTYSKWGGFLTDVDKFDPLFFNISPREAQLMNPNERLFLEIVWELMERAGYTPERIEKRHENEVGVYVGAMYQQYQAFAADPLQESILSLSSYSAIANRVSYFFDFDGPSLAIDTMCSSSLIAIQLACDSLLKGECQMAIAGGVNLSLHPNKYIGLSLSQMIGRQNTSKSFGQGDGYLPAEGVGAVLLKPLVSAIEDRDSILAVIKSISTNHGGHSQGFQVPNPNRQAKLIEANFRKSGIDPRTITYVEAAANGSSLGDPIEVNALKKAFEKFTQERGFCAIGSVKSNIGHAEAASGISQLTKVILQLQHRQLVPSINAESLNPNLSFDNSPFYLQQKLQPWERPVLNIKGIPQEFPRRATVSSFGAGGSNAHLIIEEYIPTSGNNSSSDEPDFPSERQLMVFSAKSRDRLERLLQQMKDFVQANQELSLREMAYTLQLGRTAMSYRIAILVDNREELLRGIQEALSCLAKDTVVDTSIPIYLGNLESDRSDLKYLLSGKSGEAMMKVLLAENELEKIALYWVNGGNIPWQLLHENRPAGMILLPTYPFAKRHCWVDAPREVNLSSRESKNLDWDQTTRGRNSESVAENLPILTSQLGIANSSIETAVRDIMLLTLKLTAEELNLNTPLAQYGVDSLMFVQIFQQIKAKVDERVDFSRLQQCQTTREILLYLQSQGNVPPTEAEQTVDSSGSDGILFPELIQLNLRTQGRPVFWFHGLGGVTVYEPVAAKIQRPFYGIQPWSWIETSVITSHIKPLVKGYLDAIRSVQPQGPYDFGGYSMGGMLAYEATRQLQEQGEMVATIVMIDTLPHDSGKMKQYSRKTDYLIIVNRALTLSAWQESAETVQKMLINSDQLDASLRDEEYLTQLIALAKKQGLAKTETEIRASVEQAISLDEFYQTDPFTFMSLPDSHAVNCYYFRNKNGLMVGEQAPYYFATPEDRERFATTDPSAAQQWAKYLPNLQIIDVDSSSHMTMLSEDKSRQTIVDFCATLYSLEGGL